MKTFELLVNILQKVDIQAESIEQAEEMLRQRLEANPKTINGVWDIIVPKEI